MVRGEGWCGYEAVQAHTDARSTKSGWDSAVLGGLVRIGSNPSGSRPNFFGRQHLTFDKGGKFSDRDSAENLIDGGDREQSLRLGGRKVWQIKKADVLQVKRNRATVCALPSSHLPLTREARTWCGARGGCDFATVVVMAVLGATGGASKARMP